MTFDRDESRRPARTIRGTEPPRPSLVFRIGGLVACANVALLLVIRAATRAEDVVVLRVLADVALAVLFAIAFWLNTGPTTSGPTPRRAMLLFALQVLIATTVTDYFFIVAATAPLVFSPRGAFAWLGLQLTLFVGVAILLVMQGMDIVIPEVTDAPKIDAVVASIVYVACW